MDNVFIGKTYKITEAGFNTRRWNRHTIGDEIVVVNISEKHVHVRELGKRWWGLILRKDIHLFDPTGQINVEVNG